LIGVKSSAQKQQVKRVIENVLDKLPQSYNDKIWPHSVEKVYQHVFDVYMGQGVSVYAA
jgi:type I restriction enzyme R subunit